QVDESQLLKYDIGAPIAFPNYSLLQAPSGAVYLIVDDERRGIDSIETFNAIGYSTDEIVPATNEDLSAYREGKKITIDSIYPDGHLLQDTTSGGVYFVQDGVKQPLVSKAVLDINFEGWRIHPTLREVLDTYETGDEVKLPDGTLVKADDPTVYVISEGERLPILSGDVFEQMGFKWENIKVVDERTLKLHRLGDEIEGPTIEVEDED
ncbi:MAG: hypothetical protein AAB865_02935, partial [Patescibacteria group bacterium]